MFVLCKLSSQFCNYIVYENCHLLLLQTSNSNVTAWKALVYTMYIYIQGVSLYQAIFHCADSVTSLGSKSLTHSMILIRCTRTKYQPSYNLENKMKRKYSCSFDFFYFCIFLNVWKPTTTVSNDNYTCSSDLREITRPTHICCTLDR